jgi:molybdate-binding protein/DNA-binding transcriptional regulator YhcF (GntR family)
VDRVRLLVASGRLQPGDQLEPVRHLAERLGVNPSTVARAYQLLEQTGVIETNRRRGSVVAGRGDAGAMQQVWESRLRALMERAILEALALGYAPEEAEAAFGLQLAAWRERRHGELPARPQRGGSDRGLRFAGSHDLGLERLWAQVRHGHPDLVLSVNYVGSLEGLLALWRGEADLAGAHLLDEETGEYNLPIVRRLFPGQPLCLITLAERQQGLIVPRGNPLGLTTWQHLAQPGLRFINRQPGSGTRTLLDYHLRRGGIAPAAIIGYDTAMSTHMAVAAAVAEDRADAGLGLYAAARAYGLDFVPLARERYDLVLQADLRQREPAKWLVELLKTHEYQAVLNELGGYETGQSGHEIILFPRGVNHD